MAICGSTAALESTAFMLIECVPNVSEGRRPEVVAAMADGDPRASPASACSTIRPTRRTTARSSRSPATPAASKRAVLALFERAVAAIDLRTHTRRASAPRRRRRRAVRSDRGRRRWRTASRCAKDVGAEVAARFGVPVYLYEEASTNPARKNLEDIRRGEFEGLAAKMATAGWAPDFGPAAPHPTRRRDGHRRAHAAHRLQHQPRDRSARRREEDRRRDPPQQRRLPLREGDGHHARGPRHRAGVDEPDELREDADLPRVRNGEARGRALRRRRSWKARSSGWCPPRRSTPPPSSTCRSKASTPTRFWRTSCDEARPSKLIASDRFFVVFVGSSRRRDAERLHLPIEVAALDAEHVGGARHVALLLGQRRAGCRSRSKRSRASCSVQALAGASGAARRCDSAVGSRKLRSAAEIASPGHHDHQPLDHVAQLAHVARPRVALQHRRARPARSVFEPPAVLARELRHEVLGEQRDVLLPLAQRRHEDRDHVQPEVEILAETARRGSPPADPCWSPRARARRP